MFDYGAIRELNDLFVLETLQTSEPSTLIEGVLQFPLHNDLLPYANSVGVEFVSHFTADVFITSKVWTRSQMELYRPDFCVSNPAFEAGVRFIF